MKTGLTTLAVAACVMTIGQLAMMQSAAAQEDTAATEATSLYERLGAWDGIEQIVWDTIDLHMNNPVIKRYFKGVDVEQLAAHVTAFFAAGTGGPSRYEGRDMMTTHAGMNMSDADFDSAVADVMTAVSQNGVDEASQAEVAAILESLRPAVMGTTTQ